MKYRGIFIAGIASLAINIALIKDFKISAILLVVALISGLYILLKPTNGIAILIACVISIFTASAYRYNIDNMVKNIDNIQHIRATAILLYDRWYLIDENETVYQIINSAEQFSHLNSYELDFKASNVSENSSEFFLNQRATMLGIASNIEELTETLPLPKLAKTALYIDSLIKNIIINTHSDYKGITLAMIFSEKAYTDADTLQIFKRTGIYHLTAVSGIHISILLSALAVFIPFLKRSPSLRLVIFAGFGYIIFMFSGYSASAFRAVSIACIQCLAEILDRDNDPINTSGLSLLLSLWLMPWNVLSIGFYMSYGIYFGISIFGRKLSDNLEKFYISLTRKYSAPTYMKNIFSIISISLICSVVSSLFTVAFFGTISPFSSIISLITAPFMSPLLISGYLGTIAMAFGFMGVSKFFLAITNALSGVIFSIAQVFDKIPNVYIDIYSKASLKTTVLLILILCFIILIFLCGIKFSKTSIISSVILLFVYTLLTFNTKYPQTRFILPKGSSSLILEHKNKLTVINASTGNAEYIAKRLISNLSNPKISAVYDILYKRSYKEKVNQFKTFSLEHDTVFTPQIKLGNSQEISGLRFYEQSLNYTKVDIGDRKLLLVYGEYGNKIETLAENIEFTDYDIVFTQNASLLYKDNVNILKLPYATVLEFT